MKKYSLIYADPPWSYSNSVSNGAAVNHYGTMSLAELKRLPVWSLARQTVVDFWDWLALLERVTRMNGGNYTRQNQESVLIAVRGRGLERKSASVKQVIYSPLGEHSGKPGEARYRLEQLYGDVERIELFSRGNTEGWAAWGNECHNSMRLAPAYWENAE